MKRIIRNILALIFILIFAFSAWQLWRTCSKYKEGKDNYDMLEQYALYAESKDTYINAMLPTTSSIEDCTAATELPDISAWPLVNFAQLSKINPDIVGWIIIDGTNINYPVVQGTDNDYYLKHLFDGTANDSGCIFLDYRCSPDFSDRHSIIYGHHMNNKTMFSGLMNYKKQVFYDQHSVALLVTPTAYYKIQFFSGYVSDNWSNAWDLYLDDSDYSVWLNEILEKSCFDTSCVPTLNDNIITLSTCTNEFSNAKFLLHGYISERIEKGSLGE